MIPVHEVAMRDATDAERQAYANAKTDNAKEAVVARVERRVEVASKPAPNPVKGAKLLNLKEKAPEKAPEKAAPEKAPEKAPAADPDNGRYGVVLAPVGGILRVCEIRGTGFRNKVHPIPTYTIDVLCGPDGGNATAGEALVLRQVLSADGVDSIGFDGVVSDETDTLIPDVGTTLDAIAAALSAVCSTVWNPLTELPAIGARVRLYAPLAGGGEGSRYPVEGIVTVVGTDGSVTIAPTSGEARTIPRPSGLLYRVPASTSLPLYGEAWRNMWSLRVAHDNKGSRYGCAPYIAAPVFRAEDRLAGFTF